MANSQCLNRVEAAKFLACSTRYLDKLRLSGDLPCVRLGRKPVFMLRDLEGFLESRRSGGGC